MGSRTDGNFCDHIVSDCCNATIRFKVVDDYSIQAWCQKCSNYKFSGRIETLIALWKGNKEAVIKNIGYLPRWLSS